jgi:hypothetical protein
MRLHPLVWFYLLAFGWTWTVDLLLLGLWHHQPAGGTGGVGDALDALRSILLAALAFHSIRRGMRMRHPRFPSS